MDWQPDRSSWLGDTPGQDEGLPDVPSGFAHDGPWAAAPPSAALAAALEAAAGPDDLYEGADTDAKVGAVRQWDAIESYAAARKLGALRSMMWEGPEGAPVLRRRAELPGGWDDSLNYEVAGELAMGPVSAGNLAALAWALGARLPGTGGLLANGTLTLAKARLVVQVFEPLSDAEAARAEALLLPELAGKKYFQVERLAWRAAVTVAPDVAERRRTAAERARARVTIFREEAGTVGLSGRDLSAAEALSGHANVLARAAEYEASGAFPGRAAGSLQALAYLDLLNGVSAEDRVAFARAGAGRTLDDDRPPDDDPGPDSSGPEGPAPDEPGPGDPSPDGLGPAHGSPRDSGVGGGHSRPGGGPDTDGRGPGGAPDIAEGAADVTSVPGADGAPAESPGHPVALPEIAVPLVTLLRQGERPGDNRLLGALDPALARNLADAAARSPGSRWEVTIVDRHGYAIGHGPARDPRHRQKPGATSPPDVLPGVPLRVNITVTVEHLRRLAAGQPRQGAPPSAWTLTPTTLTGNDHGTWTLTLPDGRQLTVPFDSVPTHACDHRHQTSSYQPTARLRRLVQVRDHECTFPTCTRPARESDFEHALPYDQGGRTDACNAGARSRRCHQVKQLPGWTVTQPRPGWHVWTTPTGRTYTQEPWRYPT